MKSHINQPYPFTDLSESVTGKRSPKLKYLPSRFRFQGTQYPITNHIDLGASTIAAIYKDRWQIEIFFKALKQNLKIKTFIGTSPNAAKIQIWTALIAMLILKYLQLRSKFHWSLSNLVALLRMNLFTHRDLWAWLNKPFDIPPVPYQPDQLKLNLA